MIWFDAICMYSEKVIIVCLNLHEVSSSQIKINKLKKQYILKWTMQEVRKKQEGLIAKNLRQFTLQVRKRI